MWLSAIGWEIAEYPLKEYVPGLFPRHTQDRLPNMAGDVAAVAFGWWLVDRVKR